MNYLALDKHIMIIDGLKIKIDMKLNRIIQESIHRLINEIKGDNLHEYINCLMQFAREGSLPNDDTDLKTAMTEANMGNCDKIGVAYDNLIDSINDRLDDEDRDEYYYELDDEEQTELMRQQIQLEQDDIIETIYNDIQEVTTENGWIKVNRYVEMPEFSKMSHNQSQFAEALKGHLGIYWSYVEEGVSEALGWGTFNHQDVLDGKYAMQGIRFIGYVRISDVNWNETLVSNWLDPEEYEITVNKDADIMVTQILVDERHSIWNKPMLFKA